MASVDWDHYQVPLSPQPARVPSAPAGEIIRKPLASRGARLVAKVIDYLLALAPLVLGFVLTQGWAASPQTAMVRLRLWGFALLAITIAQMTLLALRGQTLGKMAMSVRIVDDVTDENPGFARVVVLRSLVPALISALPCIGGLFALVDVLMIFVEG